MSAALTDLLQLQLTKLKDDPISGAITVAIALVVASILLRLIRGSSEDKIKKLKTQQSARILQHYTPEEVAVHNKEGDFWLIIRDKQSNKLKVYDLTEYADVHPGGDSIYSNAGGDATEGFHGPQHPPTVFDLITEYHIGYVDEN